MVAAPGHTSEFKDDVEAARLDDPGRDVDDFDLATAKYERSPRLVKCLVQGEDELFEIAADQAVDVLGGAGRSRQPVLKQRAALE